ncbi:hypothetical protein GN958_ATG10746 [Phytophthora infestans]|uniref:Uncharacterized protein n=1 Tax=Phytophthora infestans TaxID=4787 RepID=A0A8S9UHN1_PHYIN|nr:hypothetical protein GN958_ATG10746 [Phytophthora infestans]
MRTVFRPLLRPQLFHRAAPAADRSLHIGLVVSPGKPPPADRCSEADPAREMDVWMNVEYTHVRLRNPL